jgi:hypothetical protein
VDGIAFPVRIGRNGWLVRSHSPAESVIELLRIMVNTSQQGWRSLAAFGMREMLAVLGSKPGAQLTVIKQMNQTLAELGIDWVRVEAIQSEQTTEPYSLAYIFTLVYPGKGTETHRIESESGHRTGER